VDESLPWEISFYVEDNGVSPVADFFSALPLDAQKHILEKMERLARQNTTARFPLVDHLEGKLWELRAGCHNNPYRFIYCLGRDQYIVFFHGFHKKTQKTPRRELKIAITRYNRYLTR